ncbi:MAG: SDR family oxidoreductase [Candidatus Shapirobacteria bacterium]|jgi:NAD(P)-dependent dehydrogenase (short-subunit alcohol dehydrogenase family)
MKNILVTGALRGIGKSVLQVLHDESFNIIGIYNSTESEVEKISKDFPNTQLHKVDLSSRLQINEFVTKLGDTKLFAIINVAGIALGDSVGLFSLDQWDQTMEVNLTAPLMLSTLLANNLENGGSIVNVTSVYGSQYGMNMSLSYSSSKAALSNLTKSLSYQLRDKNIRVNAVSPSIVDTDMTSQDTKEMLDEVARRTPVGRIAKSVEIANVVSFLISEKASYINGQTIIADGGYSSWDGIY